MAKRQRKVLLWTASLVEALLLQTGWAVAANAPNMGPDAGSAIDSRAVFSDSGDGMAVFGDSGDAAGTSAEDLYLDVTLNGVGRGLARFGLRDQALWASATTLEWLGFVLPDGTDSPVRLDGLHGVQARYDALGQRAIIEAPLGLLNSPITMLGQEERLTPQVSTVPGLLFNYDLYGTHSERYSSSLNAFTELRAFSARGVFSTTGVVMLARDHVAEQQRDRFTRLDTSWSTSFPDKMVTLRLGDTLTGTSSWSRATRIGGVQIARNFSLQPYFVTTPVPVFLGSAALPSTVELYIDGMRRYSGEVPSGPFQMNTLPGINGTGNAQIVQTDMLGRTTTLNFSFYSTPRLLAQGLSDWSVELGAVRKSYGITSATYGHGLVASGTWRYGVTNSFTAETHAEVAGRLANVGLGGSWLLGQAGVFSGAMGYSDKRGDTGSLLKLGYDLQRGRFNFTVGGTRSFSQYHDIASSYDSPLPRMTAHAVGSYSFESAGSASLGYVHLRNDSGPAKRYANASWFKSIGRSASVNLSLNQNLVERSDRSLFISFAMMLDAGTSLGGSVERSNGRTNATLDAGHPAPSEGGIGWRVSARGGQSSVSGGQAEVNYLGRYGRLMAGTSAVDGATYAYGGASGALVFMQGHLFAARSIADGFAVVTTDGVPAVPVQLENRPVGVTNADGMLFVTQLHAYQANQLSIDPMQLPADLRVERVKAVAAPSERAGTVVRFGITPVRAASIALVDERSEPLPLGSEVRVHGQSGEPALIGYDGVVYLDTLEEYNVLDVSLPTGHCRAELHYQKQGNGIPQVGPLMCRRK